jgi:hypothetical protein
MSPHSLGSKLHSKFISYVLFLYGRIRLLNFRDIGMVWDFFDRLLFLSEAQDFEVVILMTPYETTLTAYDQKHESVKKKAASHGFGVVDPKESWQGQAREFRDALYDAKGTHYAALGMQEVADLLFDYFVSSTRLAGE